MKAAKMLTIICYDIADNRRRRHVANELEGWGERVQDSVFECHLDAVSLRQLQQTLAPMIDTRVDKIGYYALCGKDRADIRLLGKGRVQPDIAYWLA